MFIASNIRTNVNTYKCNVVKIVGQEREANDDISEIKTRGFIHIHVFISHCDNVSLPEKPINICLAHGRQNLPALFKFFEPATNSRDRHRYTCMYHAQARGHAAVIYISPTIEEPEPRLSRFFVFKLPRKYNRQIMLE